LIKSGFWNGGNLGILGIEVPYRSFIIVVIELQRPWQDIAVSTSWRHLERYCARFGAELRPMFMLCCWRSSSTVRSL